MDSWLVWQWICFLAGLGIPSLVWMWNEGVTDRGKATITTAFIVTLVLSVMTMVGLAK
jgi:hypothetical protein